MTTTKRKAKANKDKASSLIPSPVLSRLLSCLVSCFVSCLVFSCPEGKINSNCLRPPSIYPVVHVFSLASLLAESEKKTDQDQDQLICFWEKNFNWKKRTNAVLKFLPNTFLLFCFSLQCLGEYFSVTYILWLGKYTTMMLRNRGGGREGGEVMPKAA
jgi:hypothetical protein